MEKNNLYFNETMYSKFKHRGHTDFLDKVELNSFLAYLNKKKEIYNLYFIYEEADKVIVYKNTIPSISCFRIECRNELKHSSILGGLFALQISSTLFSDIILHENYFYFCCLDEISSYIFSSLNQIGKDKIVLKDQNVSVLKKYKRRYEEKIILVSSTRLDNVLSHLLNCSRKTIDELFRDKKVLLNYEIPSKTKKLKENDIFSIRKYGKYRYIGIENVNKKGKMYLKIQKYI